MLCWIQWSGPHRQRRLLHLHSPSPENRQPLFHQYRSSIAGACTPTSVTLLHFSPRTTVFPMSIQHKHGAISDAGGDLSERATG